MATSTLKIRTGKFYDGTLDQPRSNVIVTIEDERIASVAPADGAKPDREAAAIVPGLINAHAHLEFNGEPNVLSVVVLLTSEQKLMACVENARKTLRAGVTAVRDLGSSGRNNIEARNAIQKRQIEGPTIVAAGQPIVMTGGHGWWAGAREADGPWDVRQAVREQLKAGADCIKMMATGGVLTPGAVPGNDQLTEEEMRAGVTEAHTHGMRVTTHAIGTNGIKNAIRAGVDSIEHGMLIDDEGIALMKERGTMLVPTLNACMGIVENGEGAGIPKFMVDKARAIVERMGENFRRARKAGVRFAGGSDAGTPFNYHDGYWREIELMVEILEMTPQEALHAATQVSGELLRVPEGHLTPGAFADLLLLDGDLERTMTPLKKPVAVVKRGSIAFQRV
ncbi:MAG: amidohydrolase family protein [Vulcanimicrobiaceae bacterium]